MLARFLTVAFLAVATLSIGAPAEAATISVTENEDELNTDGDCSLREAIEAANTNAAVDACTAGSGSVTDRIDVPANTYTLSIPNGDENANQTGDLDVIDDALIVGANARTTIIDGNDIDRVFHVGPGGLAIDVELQNLTVQDGTEQVSNDCGGAIRVESALVATRIAVLDSQSRCGGGFGVFPATATLTLRESLVAGNRASPNDVGGGLQVESGASATIENTTISGNQATEDGGGVWVQSATADFNNVTIAGNVADSDANQVGDGGGIFDDGATTISLTNTLVGDNDDASSGANPQHDDCSGTVQSGGYNLIENTPGCTITGTTTGNITGQDPRLQALADNGGQTDTHALRNNSPAVDAGNPANETGTGGACEPEDQRGFARPRGPRCDIGAFERGAGEQLRCFNKKATFVGTNGVDEITGGNGRDVIVALGGDDVITAGGGNDLVCTGPGNDRVKAQGGADQVLGESGNDRARGGGGSDTLIGKAGRDKLKGQAAPDTLKGGGGKDRLNGGGTTDRCVGGPGKDRTRRCES